MWPWETAKQAIEERYNALKAQEVANKNLQQASAVSLAQKGWDPEMGIPRMGGNQTRFSELTPEEKNVITGANISLVGGLTTGVGARSQKYLDAVGKLATKELPAQQKALNVIKNEAQRQLTPQELNSVKDWSDQKLIDKIYKRLETERNAVSEAGSKSVDTMPNLLKKTDPLIEEAKKYKSAEEFVKAQGAPVYHGTNADFKVFDKSKIGSATDEGFFGRGFYFANTKDFARIAPGGREAKNIMDVYPSPNIKLFDIAQIKDKKQMADLLNMSEDALIQDSNGIIRPVRGQSGQFTSHLQDLGYDGAVINRGGDAVETVIFEPDKIKTKSQLTDIWNKAQSTSSKAMQSRINELKGVK